MTNEEAINLPDKVRTRAQELIDTAGRAEITDEDTLSKGGDLIKFINSFLKKIEEDRKSWVKPLNDQVKRINEEFKKLSGPLTDAKSTLQKKLNTYVEEREALEEERRKKEQEERERKALEQAEEAAVSGNSQKADEIIEAAADQKPEKSKAAYGTYGSTTSARREWVFKIENPNAVPMQFWVNISSDEERVRAHDIPALAIDGRKIREHIDAGKEIPGIKTWQRVAASVR